MCDRKRIISLAMASLMAMSLLAGCGQNADVGADVDVDLSEGYVDEVVMEEIDLEGEAVALSAAPAVMLSNKDGLLMPVASGKAVKKNDKAVIDYSNAADGYVMVKFTGTTEKTLRVQVFGPTTQEAPYKYYLKAGVWTTFPLSDGSGDYKVTVYENTTGTKYASVVSASFKASLKDEFAPFVRPNQYVDYENAPNTIAKGEELAGSIEGTLGKVEAVYKFVVNEFTYDKERAAEIKKGSMPDYTPVLDSVLAEKKGICFDYAAVMAAMLRSQGVPCKMVTGYAGSGTLHAWISVWTDEGWVEGAIFFDGTAWHRMDPTYASSGHSSKKMMEFIGNGSNYTEKCFY